MEHDCSIQLEKGYQDFSLFINNLTNKIKSLIVKPENSSNKYFNFDYFFRNPKKIALYFQNEGKGLYSVKSNKKMEMYQNDIINSMLKLILMGQKRNFVFNDLCPENINFYLNFAETPLSGNNSISLTDFSTLGHHSTSTQNTKVSSNHLPFRIRVFKDSKTIKQIFTSSNKAVDDSVLSQGEPDKSRIRLKVKNYFFSEKVNFDFFIYKIEQTINYFIEYLDSKNARLDRSLINSDVVFDKEIDELASEPDNVHLSLAKQRKESEIMNSTRTIDFHFDYEDNLSDYKSNINTLHGHGTRAQEAGPDSADQRRKGLEICELVLEQKPNLIDSLKNMFMSVKPVTIDDFDFKKIKLEMAQKVEIIKSIALAPSLRSNSIFDFMKVRPGYVGDAENCFYSLLYVLGKYPKAAPIKRRSSLMSVRRTSIMTSSLDADLRHNSLKEEKIRSPFSEGQIEILVYILAIIDKDRFVENQLAVLMMFGYFRNLKSQDQVKMVFEKQGEKLELTSDFFVKGSDSSRFGRLKMILENVSKNKRENVFQLFGLDHLSFKHFLIKLGLEFFPFFEKLPPKLKKLYWVIKKFMFQYLIFLMFSNKYSFLHKFLIIAILKAKD